MREEWMLRRMRRKRGHFDKRFNISTGLAFRAAPAARHLPGPKGPQALPRLANAAGYARAAGSDLKWGRGVIHDRPPSKTYGEEEPDEEGWC
jgi:hypothetical protein